MDEAEVVYDFGANVPSLVGTYPIADFHTEDEVQELAAGRAIALTAYAGDFNQQQALSAGFQQHVSKPVEPEVLARVIASLLSHTKR
ncbi:MAG: hypothetical protein RMY16_00230 [Nostoc sp. DedQUE12b]|uniref:hypothetical protein n=1 Tax=Nostoc sp. DedQUE12b TaxID=3075398 RepID=UPI002AD1FA80|nr:hypothetical protein [Nostoc sp. DedQUE12b]MDZ8084016.1 hypothetical protein [Nostoc sp. DedQUE12b]